MGGAAGDEPLLVVFVAYLEPLAQNAAIERLLLLARLRKQNLALLHEISKQRKGLPGIVVIGCREELVDEVILKCAVTVAPHGLFS